MKVLVLAVIKSFLPVFGIAWDGEDECLRLSHISDDRMFRYFRRWLDCQLASNPNNLSVKILSNSKTLREELSTLLSLDYGQKLADADVLPLYEYMAGEEKASAQAMLLPALTDKARRLWPDNFPEELDKIRVDHFKFVCSINEIATTVTEATANTLNVLPTHTKSTFLQCPSLLGFLNRTASAMGSRRLRHWLEHPLIDANVIHFRQKVIKSFLDNRIIRVKIHHQIIGKMLDLDMIVFQLAMSAKLSTLRKRNLILKMSDLLETIDAAGQLIHLLDEDVELEEGIASPAYCEQIKVPLQASVEALQKLRSLILHVFDVDALKRAKKEEDILILKTSLLASVKDASEEVNQLLEDMESHLLELQRELSNAKIRLVNGGAHGKIFRAPKSVEVPSSYSLIRVNKAETLFTSKALTDLNKALRQSHAIVVESESIFVQKVLQVAETYTTPLKQLADVIGVVDILCSFAAALSILPATSRWILPQVDPTCPKLHVDAGKHPLLEIQAALGGAGTDTIIANSSQMDSENRMLLVTGPNMGGKSTFARQCGLLSLMGQYGCYVPALKMKFSPFEVIWTRVGAEDTPSKGISTFMSEAIETAMMLKSIEKDPSQASSKPSLLIIDELGRGTSVKDGLCLAYAVMTALTSSDTCLSIFATHFHELAAANIQGVQAVCLSSIKDALSTLESPCIEEPFKLKKGVESDSDGILLAKKFGLPSEIIEVALAHVRS